MEPTVFIVDDDNAVRDSLALLVSLQGFPTRTFASARAFLEEVGPDWAGCALIDLRMPDMSGLELQAALVERGIPLPLIIITAHGDVTATRQALKSGALDFIEKPIDDTELLGAIRAAWKQDTERRQSARHATQFKALLDRLTPREREVLDRVVAGQHNREIAQALGISARTVEVHKARLMEKLRVERIPNLMRAMITADRDNPADS
ncbi:MAG: response regulator transcription factor [Burkholderiales bacterium]